MRIVALWLVGLLFGPVVSWAGQDPPMLSTAYRVRMDLTVRGNFGLAGGTEMKQVSAGSGVLVSPDGYLITNAHVINPDRAFWKLMQTIYPSCIGKDKPPDGFDAPLLRRVDSIVVRYRIESLDRTVWHIEYEILFDVWYSEDARCPPDVVFRGYEKREPAHALRSARMISFNEEYDLALLKLDIDYSYPYARIASAPVVPQQRCASDCQEVYALGAFQDGRDGITILESRGRVLDSVRFSAPLPANSIKLAMPSAPGFSGAGVFAKDDHELVGIMWGYTVNERASGGNEFLSYMIPARIVEKFFKECKFLDLQFSSPRSFSQSP